MKSFMQYIEVLAGHGGHFFNPTTGTTSDTKFDSIQKHSPWEFLDMSVNKRDSKYLFGRYKKIIDELDKRLINLGKFNIHIYFGAPAGYFRKFADGEHKEIVKNLTNYFFSASGLNIPKTDIVFVKRGSTGDILKSWMILHTFGHALLDNFYEVHKNMDYLVNKIFLLFNVEDFASAYKMTMDGEPLLSCLFNFASMRGIGKPVHGSAFRALRDSNEVAHELVASYLWNSGKISRPTVECYQKLYNIYNEDGVVSSAYFDFNNFVRYIEGVFVELDDAVTGAMEKARGKVLID
jgi:hypothetical protein